MSRACPLGRAVGLMTNYNVEVPFLRVKPLRSKISGDGCIKVLAGKNIHVDSLHQIQSMDHDCTCEDELYCTGALCLGIGLLLFFRHAHVVPEVQVTTLHVD